MQRTTTRRLARTGTFVLATMLTLTACGTSSDPVADPSETPSETAAPSETASETEPMDASAFPVTVTDSFGAEVVIDDQPGAIVSLSATSTEILFAIGAGDQVVAVDDFSNFPAEAPMTDLSGFQPNVEAVLGFDPDLVVLQFDPGDVVAGLTAAGVPAIVHDSAKSLDDTFTQIEQLGVATGHVAEAAKLVAEIQADLANLADSVPQSAAGLSYYHELDDTYFTTTSSTFIGELYGLFGLENIADPADEDGSSFGFPQLSAEFIVEANPDLIFLACTKFCTYSTESVGERDGWDQITAVRNGDLIELDDDIASRWGPRVVDFVESIAAAIQARVAN